MVLCYGCLLQQVDNNSHAQEVHRSCHKGCNLLSSDARYSANASPYQSHGALCFSFGPTLSLAIAAWSALGRHREALGECDRAFVLARGDAAVGLPALLAKARASAGLGATAEAAALYSAYLTAKVRNALITTTTIRPAERSDYLYLRKIRVMCYLPLVSRPSLNQWLLLMSRLYSRQVHMFESCCPCACSGA